MKTISAILLAGLLSGCAYVCVQSKKPIECSVYSIRFFWKTGLEMTVATNGVVSIKGTSGDDTDAIKAVTEAAVSAAVKAAGP